MVGSEPIRNERTTFNYSCLEFKKKDAKRKKKEEEMPESFEV